jgi:hypothetical protein
MSLLLVDDRSWRLTRLHNTRSVARHALLLRPCLLLRLLLLLLPLLLLQQGAVTPHRPVTICWQQHVFITAVICSQINDCCRIGTADPY